MRVCAVGARKPGIRGGAVVKVLVTGARGFVGSNLCAALRNIRDGKDRRDKHQALLPLTVLAYDSDGTDEELESYAGEADFVFSLAGVNRPKDDSEFMEGNARFIERLIVLLENRGNTCPVMYSSSVQASLKGRFANSRYGESKLAGERAVREHAERTGSRALIYRLPNLFGKWCRPNYNSVVATFCHNIAHDLPIAISDPEARIELLYIDDLVEELLAALLGEEHRIDACFCEAGPTSSVTLGEIAGLLHGFKESRVNLAVPDLSEGSFSKQLYSTYLSYLDPVDFAYKLKKTEDARGSFTEFLRTPDRGQVSVNVSKPGMVKGQHWHQSKWEKFLVVSGEALIRLRRVGVDAQGGPYPVVEYRVSGDDPTVVEMIPGYAHSIENLSDERDLVTVMWANEAFDPMQPDTYYEEV